MLQTYVIVFFLCDCISTLVLSFDFFGCCCKFVNNAWLLKKMMKLVCLWINIFFYYRYKQFQSNISMLGNRYILNRCYECANTAIYNVLEEKKLMIKKLHTKTVFHLSRTRWHSHDHSGMCLCKCKDALECDECFVALKWKKCATVYV